MDRLARNARFHSKAPHDVVLEVLARIEAILQIEIDREAPDGRGADVPHLHRMMAALIAGGKSRQK